MSLLCRERCHCGLAMGCSSSKNSFQEFTAPKGGGGPSKKHQMGAGDRLRAAGHGVAPARQGLGAAGDSKHGCAELESAAAVEPVEKERCVAINAITLHTCALCFCDEHTLDQGLFCQTETEASAANSSRHFMCHECVQSAAISKTLCFAPITNKAGFSSKLGQLPCFYFAKDDPDGVQCACAAMDQHALTHAVAGSPDALRAYLRMFVDIGEEAASAEAKKQLDEMRVRQEVALREGEDMPRQVADVVENVEAALLQGLHVSCPQCNTAWFKDDACMHMTCGDPSCETEFCYVCGRASGTGPNQCPRRPDAGGCDAENMYLESQPGWGAFARGDETEGQGALHEFHRLRCAALVREVKSTVRPDVWERVRFEHADLLADVAEGGRSVDWDEVDRAEHPWFGDNRDRAPTLRERCANEARGCLHEEERKDFEARLLEATALLVAEARAWDCAEYSDAHVRQLAERLEPCSDAPGGAEPEPEPEPVVDLACRMLRACHAEERLSAQQLRRQAIRTQLSARQAKAGTERRALTPTFVLAIEEQLSQSEAAVVSRIHKKSATLMAAEFRRVLGQIYNALDKLQADVLDQLRLPKAHGDEGWHMSCSWGYDLAATCHDRCATAAGTTVKLAIDAAKLEINRETTNVIALCRSKVAELERCRALRVLALPSKAKQQYDYWGKPVQPAPVENVPDEYVFPRTASSVFDAIDITKKAIDATEQSCFLKSGEAIQLFVQGIGQTRCVIVRRDAGVEGLRLAVREACMLPAEVSFFLVFGGRECTSLQGMYIGGVYRRMANNDTVQAHVRQARSSVCEARVAMLEPSGKLGLQFEKDIVPLQVKCVLPDGAIAQQCPWVTRGMQVVSIGGKELPTPYNQAMSAVRAAVVAARGDWASTDWTIGTPLRLGFEKLTRVSYVGTNTNGCTFTAFLQLLPAQGEVRYTLSCFNQSGARTYDSDTKNGTDGSPCVWTCATRGQDSPRPVTRLVGAGEGACTVTSGANVCPRA